MDTDEFLKRCDEIQKGLHQLGNDLYGVVRDGSSGKEKEDLLSRSKEKVRLYDEFIALLDDEEDKQEAQDVLGDYIGELRQDIEKLEMAEPTDGTA